MEMMSLNESKLFFLAPGDVLKGRVEPTIWMRMCHAFARMGLAVELVSLFTWRPENIGREHIFDHYGIKDPRFPVTILPTPLGRNPPTWWSRLCTAGLNGAYALDQGLRRQSGQQYKHLIFYTRGPAAIYPYWSLRSLFGSRPLFVFETHAMPVSSEAVAVLRRMDGVVVTTRQLAADMVADLGIAPSRVHVAYLAPNAVPSGLSRADACRQLELDPAKRYVVFTGKLLLTEVRLMLDAAQIVGTTAPDTEFLFVGGNPDILPTCQAEAATRGLANVRFTGFVAPSEVAVYQMAADVLLVYLMKGHLTIKYTTPGKVFDYLQAGRPIIASDYPILGEILHDGSNALMVPPEEPASLAAAIVRILRDPDLAARLSRQALIDSRQYTWEQRTQSIWEFLQRVEAEVHAPAAGAAR
jgi:glycosyltransferase involved in cell wall biosynthesis